LNTEQRFHSLDAVRTWALLAGIVLHATMSYLPGFGALNWPIIDQSTSETLGLTFFVIHIFRMALFFIVAGFFARLLHQRLGTAGLIWNRLRRIALPLLAAMVLVLPLTIGAIIWAAVQVGAKGGPPAIASPPVIGPPIPLGHLWFLYLLLLFYAGTLLLRGVVVIIDRTGGGRSAASRVLAGLIGSRLAPVVLALPVAAVLLSAKWWLVWMGVPVPAVGLVPNLPALFVYGAAFLLGWMLHRDQQTLRRMAADWGLYFAVAVAATVAAWWFAGAALHFGLQPVGEFERTAFAGAYSLALWCWCFACLGAAVRFLDDPSPRTRYLADASYWMYLVHLPIVWLLQAWMLRWPAHWSVKFTLTLAVTAVLLFASYHYLVRSTFIGVFLNGRRYPKSPVAGQATSTPSTSPG
jgi:glucan biosynthesis protein C